MSTARNIANRVPITIAMMLATLMVTLDGTIANVALPHIQGSLSAAQDQVTWVLTSYIIATALMIPLSGWLSQKFGAKRLFLVSITLFTVASMACGAATNLGEIVLFRILQGLAGATLMPLSQTVMLDLFELRLVPTVMSVWSSVVIMGPIIGPALGGWLTENASWRFVFYINMPVGALSLLGIWTFMDPDPGGRQRPFDFLGFAALVAFIGGLQLMLDRGPEKDWFDSHEIQTEAIISLIGFFVFIVQMSTAEHPFFHRALSRDRNFVLTTLFSLLVGAMLFSTSALLPTMMQGLMGYPVLESGYASMPRGMGSLLAFITVPFLMRTIGPRVAMGIGILTSAAALWIMRGFDLSMSSDLIKLSGFVQGVGTGLLFAPMSALSYVTLSQAHRPEGTTLANMVRNLGSGVGISIAQWNLTTASARAHEVLAADMTPVNPVVMASAPVIGNPDATAPLALLNAEVTRQAAMIAYTRVFEVMMVGVVVVLVPLLFLMRPPNPALNSGPKRPAPEVHE